MNFMKSFQRRNKTERKKDRLSWCLKTKGFQKRDKNIKSSSYFKNNTIIIISNIFALHLLSSSSPFFLSSHQLLFYFSVKFAFYACQRKLHPGCLYHHFFPASYYHPSIFHNIKKNKYHQMSFTPTLRFLLILRLISVEPSKFRLCEMHSVVHDFIV